MSCHSTQTQMRVTVKDLKKVKWMIDHISFLNGFSR